LGTNVHNKLLPNYIASKKGNCVSMPLLFIALGQRLGIEVTAALVPSHVFVKYHDDTGNWLNLETTGTANPTADASYRKQVSMTDQSIANGLYMRPLSKKETLTVMLGTLIQHYTSQGNNTHVIGVADLVLAHYPNSINALLSRGTAFIRMRDELLSEIEGLPDVPGTQAILSAEKMSISEYERINARAFDQAEALGWREPTPEENIAYLQRIQQQIPLQTTQSKE